MTQPGDETRYNLEIDVSATILANGTGQAVAGPSQSSERWVVTRYACKNNSGRGVSLNLFRNFDSPSTYADGTLKGQGDTGGIQLDIPPGQKILAKWSNGFPGDIATLSLFGYRYVRGNRSYR